MLTIIFIVSLCSIATIIGLKLIEQKSRKKFFFSTLREKTDAAISDIVDSLKKHILVLNKRNAKFFAILVGRFVKFKILSVKKETELKKLRFFDSLRKRQNLKKKGPASFFLKNVSEYKEKYVK